MRDKDHINQFHCNAWIDYNKKFKLFHTTLMEDEENNKKCIASPTVEKEREGPIVLPLIVNGTFDLSMVIEVNVQLPPNLTTLSAAGTSRQDNNMQINEHAASFKLSCFFEMFSSIM